MKNNRHQYRHELKYYISREEKQAMIHRLGGLLQKDVHGGENGYSIRSLYFDDYRYQSYEDKIAGTFHRKKYRIRIYDYSDKVIKLECKEKQGSYIYKEAVTLTRQETDRILQGEYGFLLAKEKELYKRFYVECMSSRMRPAVIVDYEREAFVMEQGDVRITFDDHVRSCWMGYELFDKNLPCYEIFEPETLIMEVKYTEFLPEVVRRCISPENAQSMAASKYTMCLEKKWKISSR